MNDYEMLRVIDFLERTRAPLRRALPVADDEPVWNAVTFLIKSHIKGQVVTQSSLTQVTGLPYATGLRLVGRLIEEGHVVRTPRSRTGKTFALHPSEALIGTFSTYARQMKALLAETLGLRVSEAEEGEYYFGGTPLGSTIIPPLRLAQMRAEDNFELRFLLNEDNYFTSMRNMWADFRNNLAFRRNFDLVPLPALHAKALENGRREVSGYDVISLNMPWLGEFAEKGLIRPISELVRRTGVNALDFHPVIWSTGNWNGAEYGVPIYCTIEILAARRDLFEAADLEFPGTFAEVIRTARAFHDPRKGMTGIVWDGARGMPIASTFMFFLGACGSPPLSLRQTRQGFTLDGVEAEALVPLIDSDAGRTVLDYMHQLVEVSPPDILDMAWDRALHVFLTGRSAMAYCWTMRAARFEYDIQSVVKRQVEYLPQPAGPGGSRVSPIGGFLLAIPSNLPEERVDMAAEAIAWMTSREAMKAHVKNGFPIAPRFSVSADPEAAASSPIVRFVDRLAKRNLLQTWQRPNLPQYTRIEHVLGEEIHDAMTRTKSDAQALADASGRIEKILKSRRAAH
ncbi:multiple sugar transport system substrate-binding protein [Inquilinus ginsengisoli]|uniref:Multiple sugar transport system substrate-binding protein n=1 Tax=Inquilinus ginsengisoli TaxID=363840 RepID=A0ABU1JQE1_9PROT|nr:extracellular solute-binding protein [Inquilinus ginsengisoli]MDR6290840.1 multiple sugar transport system substrate-binding protein [Inquilinus ginsengisoli]